MGNLDSKRDWGHAKDYVEMMWLMLQQEEPTDYVISTGKQYSVRDFINLSAKELGIELEFSGKGVDEIAIVSKVDNLKSPSIQVGQTLIDVDERYYRPAEVDNLLGDASFAEKKLGWKPKITLKMMVQEMIESELKALKQ